MAQPASVLLSHLHQWPTLLIYQSIWNILTPFHLVSPVKNDHS